VSREAPGRTVDPVTRFEEKRGDGNVLGLFLAGAFALATWRGASAAPALAAVFGVLAVVTLAVWLRWRSQPPRQLDITGQAIAWGRPGQSSELRWAPDARLEIRQGFRRSGLFLGIVGDSEQLAIPLMGFDHRDVAAACMHHGWQFN
jgi:hypothetical protein